MKEKTINSRTLKSTKNSSTRKPRKKKTEQSPTSREPISPKGAPNETTYSNIVATYGPRPPHPTRNYEDAYDASPQEARPNPEPKPTLISAPAPTNKPEVYVSESAERARNREPARKPEEGPFNLVFKVGNVYGGNHATATGEIISKPFAEGKGQAYFAHIQSYTIPEVTVYGANGKQTEAHPAITGSNVLIPLNGAGRSKAERKITQFVLQQAIYGQADQTFNEWHDSEFGRKSKFTHKKKKPYRYRYR